MPYARNSSKRVVDPAMKSFSEFNVSKLKTYSAHDRPSKVNADLEAKPVSDGATFWEFLESLPNILKAGDLKKLAQAVVFAKKKQKPVIIMIGGHVIKTGCSPILINLIKKGFITHVASNGSAAIHDTELARFGHTSEDVATQLEDGSFGMAHDTALFVNESAKIAAKTGRGFGQMVGARLNKGNDLYKHSALLAACEALSIPYTLHIAIGTDIVHQHASADGAAIGEASLRDFRIFAKTVSLIGGGGVVLNFGSAVIMPEVFLKSLAMARNLRDDVHDFTTANFDMIQHYRPTANILNRPISKGGQSFAITGHHEIMIPLLAATILEYAALESSNNKPV